MASSRMTLDEILSDLTDTDEVFVDTGESTASTYFSKTKEIMHT